MLAISMMSGARSLWRRDFIVGGGGPMPCGSSQRGAGKSKTLPPRQRPFGLAAASPGAGWRCEARRDRAAPRAWSTARAWDECICVLRVHTATTSQLVTRVTPHCALLVVRLFFCAPMKKNAWDLIKTNPPIGVLALRAVALFFLPLQKFA